MSYSTICESDKFISGDHPEWYCVVKYKIDNDDDNDSNGSFDNSSEESFYNDSPYCDFSESCEYRYEDAYIPKCIVDTTDVDIFLVNPLEYFNYESSCNTWSGEWTGYTPVKVKLMHNGEKVSMIGNGVSDDLTKFVVARYNERRRIMDFEERREKHRLECTQRLMEGKDGGRVKYCEKCFSYFYVPGGNRWRFCCSRRTDRIKDIIWESIYPK